MIYPKETPLGQFYDVLPIFYEKKGWLFLLYTNYSALEEG
jgi:hypothetical protein